MTRPGLAAGVAMGGEYNRGGTGLERGAACYNWPTNHGTEGFEEKG